MKNIISFSAIFLLFATCTPDDTTKQPSSKKPNILVVGNSIVLHPQKADIGWFFNHGMAATAPDRDFY